jgi:steroid 5-alpha reductase family enzyme
MRDFLSSAAQVIPVLMLALVWESRFLKHLSENPCRLRRDDPAGGVLFWTKSRVRVWIMFTVLVAVAVAVAVLMLAMLVLAGAVGDSIALRALVLSGLALVLTSLLMRAVGDIVQAPRG